MRVKHRAPTLVGLTLALVVGVAAGCASDRAEGKRAAGTGDDAGAGGSQVGAGGRDTVQNEGGPVDFACLPEGEGVVAGNPAVSGVFAIDSFFASVIRHVSEAQTLADGMRAELDAIAASLDLPGGVTSAEISAALQARLQASVADDFTLKASPPRCEIAVRTVLESEARCDIALDPSTASVRCQGTCTGASSGPPGCEESGTTKCAGVAPDLACTGTCTGPCRLAAAAACDGICKGTCSGVCTVTDVQGDCDGPCDGACQGTCELQAGGTCAGDCEGTCTYTPSSGACPGGADTECEAPSGGSVTCGATCVGQVTPPSARAECEAGARLDAAVGATCRVPSVSPSFQLAASLQGAANASARAELLEWLQELQSHVSALLAYGAKVDGLVSSGAATVSSAEAAIAASIQAQVEVGQDVREVFGLGCALAELPVALTLLQNAGEELAASRSAVLEVLDAVGLASTGGS